MAEHATFHEPIELLSQAIMERHRAIVSLMEELEAVDWYDQRVEATTDDGIRSVMAHNRDEEKEHAAMTLEWLRRNDAEVNVARRLPCALAVHFSSAKFCTVTQAPAGIPSAAKVTKAVEPAVGAT